MDPLYYAISLYRRRRYEKCIEICNHEIENNPKNSFFWTLKLRCVTGQTYVDDLETDEEGIAEALMDENRIAETARAGTSLQTSIARQSTSQAIRPVTQTGRPLSGVIRPGTNSIIGGSIESALQMPRTGTNHSARPMTSSSGRYARLGTASMIALQESGGMFLNLERLNVDKYCKIRCLTKSLFEYIFHNQANIRIALSLAGKCNLDAKQLDWYWLAQIGKCYYKLALLRDAERYFCDALSHHDVSVTIFIWLAKVYIRMDQPLAALNIYLRGLERYPNETLLLRYAARIHETMGEMDESTELYKTILKYDAIDIEAIASIALNEFYGDQPEIALRYYRRLLQMGVFKAELYNNIALCCFYAQQYDMVVACFERALMFADSDEIVSDIWFNIGHLALSSGDRQFALYSFRLAVTSNNNHGEALNNLGVLEMMRANSDQSNSGSGSNTNSSATTTLNVQQAKSYFESASKAGAHLYEPHYNLALLAENSGDFDLSLEFAKKTLQLYPEHYATKELLERVRKLYDAV